MYRELFRFPWLDLPVYGYGLMLVVGVLLAIELAKFLARRCGINPEHFVTAGLLAMIAGIIGARLSHVLENPGTYFDPSRSVSANVLAAINIRSGGLTYYGGFLFATPVLIIYAIKKGIPILLGMDIVAPCLMVGLAFGRVGCLLNGCCWGAECKLPWALEFPYDSPPYVAQVEANKIDVPEELSQRQVMTSTKTGESELVVSSLPREKLNTPLLKQIAAAQHSLPVHPAQIYSTITASLICLLCLSFFTIRRTPGTVFALMMLVEGAGRFMLELLRAEPVVLRLGRVGFSFSMVTGVVLVIAGIVMMSVLLMRRGEDRTPRGIATAS